MYVSCQPDLTTLPSLVNRICAADVVVRYDDPPVAPDRRASWVVAPVDDTAHSGELHCTRSQREYKLE